MSTPTYGYARQESLSAYTAKTFSFMFLGLLVSFGIAAALAWTTPGLKLLNDTLNVTPWVCVGLLIATLAVVVILSSQIRKISPVAAAVWFFVYAILDGLSFSVIFVAYEFASLALVFGFTALYFGGMAAFGYLTKFDLSRLRNLLLGGLIALIVCNLLMLFIPGLQVIDHVVCTVGVVIFLAFTAYDTQKIKKYYDAFQGDDAMLKKASIISALELYLDFVNLFLHLLRLFGKVKK